MSIHSVTLRGYSAIIESSNKMYLDLGTYRSCGNEYILINKDGLYDIQINFVSRAIKIANVFA